MRADDRRRAPAAHDASDARQHLHDALEAGVRAFAAWVAQEWRYPDRVRWEAETSEPWPGEAYVRGYNDAVESVRDAVDAWLDEHP